MSFDAADEAPREETNGLKKTDEDIVISVRGLGKCYRIYDHPKDKLKEVLLFGRRKLHREFWALKEIDLDVRKGETVGIVGRNGSGKSTLLQIICSTLTPTRGAVEIRGRVAALLELGTGFDPDFTGKENVYLNATVFGLSKEEIDEKFDSIVEFADIGDFVDQPVKTYSSGMQVRLAFSVAINVQPDILVVDEALAVGDEMFQRKCYSRMHEIQESGATILFVSHSGPAVLELCDRAVLLDRGELLLDGAPKLVFSLYQRLAYAPSESRDAIRKELHALEESVPSAVPTPHYTPTETGPEGETVSAAYYDPNLVPASTISYESRGALISDPHITTLGGKRVNHLVRGEDYIFAYSVEFTEKAYYVRAGTLIKTLRGVELGGAVTSGVDDAIPEVERGTRVNVRFKFSCLLAPGAYFLNAGVEGLVDGTRTYLDRRLDAAAFRVQPEGEHTYTGMVDFCIEPAIEYENLIREAQQTLEKG